MTDIIQIAGTGFDGVHVGLLLVLLIVAVGWVWYRSHARQAADLMGRDLELAQDDLVDTRQRLRTQEEVARTAELKLAEANARSAEDERKFADLAQGVLAKANALFMERADETFKRHREGAKGELKELMKPIGDNLDTFAKRVNDIEKVRAADKSAIQEQVKLIHENLHRNTNETNKLVSALTAPKGGGRWGEMTLKNVLEQAGLSTYCDFEEQVNDTVEGVRQRPDAVIRLPGHREIVVDSKVSLEAYMKANEASDPAQRALHLKTHAANVQRHVTALASKAYQDNLSERVDFVAMFIPGENFFAAALEYAPDLLDMASAKNVIVTTPSTLIGLAKTVAFVWRQENMAENAREAAELGAELYTRLATMGQHIERLGKSLNTAVDSYNKMGSSLERRVLPTARKFDDLGIAPKNKTIEAVQPVDNRATLPDRTGELNFDDDPSKVAAE